MPDSSRKIIDSTSTRGASAPAPAQPDDIAAEIADHLATTAERLKAAGASEDEAKTQAAAKFGDAAAISRRCYWIQQGDSLMFRGAVIALLSILCLGLTITAVASWQSQARMAQQMTALTEQLKAIAERPPAALPVVAEQKPLELMGKLYDGSPDRPAALHEVLIVNAKDGTVVRRIRTDKAGHYRSGPLAAGDYSLAAAPLPPLPQRPPGVYYAQSAPTYVYPGMGSASQDFDVAYHGGRLAIELSRPLPKVTVADKYVIDARLMINVMDTKYAQNFSWTAQQPAPAKWPVYLTDAKPRGPENTGDRYIARFFELLSNQDLTVDWGKTVFASRYGLLPEGQADVSAAILVDVIPADYERFVVPDLSAPTAGDFGGARPSPSPQAKRSKGSAFGRGAERSPRDALGNIEVTPGEGPFSLTRGNAWTWDNDDFFWMSKGLGRMWAYHLADMYGGPDDPFPLSAASKNWLHREKQQLVPIVSGSVTRIRIEVPDDLEARVQALIESTSDGTAFAGRSLSSTSLNAERRAEVAADQNPFLRLVKITVVGTEPLAEPAKSPLP